jgi:hypothetical protein
VTPPIPLIEAGQGGALALYQAAPNDAAALVATALGAHPLLAAAARSGDRVSRRWLERRDNPYLAEIEAVARGIGRPGVWLLNIVYEWACSTGAGPDPGGPGNRMIRVLDWGLPGIGRYVVVGRHATPWGPYFNISWPGYVGVLTAMAPGRFSVAINQAPRRVSKAGRWPAEVASRVRMLRLRDGLPAAHLLRRVCETAPDFRAARAMLADESLVLATPAIFTVSGIEPDEAAIVEALGRRRAVRLASDAADRIVATANEWQTSDWPGDGKRYSGRCCPDLDPAADNRQRRVDLRALLRADFAGLADLRPPVLNAHTVLVATMNARQGSLTVEALDPAEQDRLPRLARGPFRLAAAA